MKKTKMLAMVMSLATLLSVTPLMATAEENKILDVNTVVLDTYELDADNPDLVTFANCCVGDSLHATVDRNSEEFKSFLKEILDSEYCSEYYSSPEFDKSDNYKVIDVSVAGFTEDGKAVLVEGMAGVFVGFDENGEPIIEKGGYYVSEIARRVGFIDGLSRYGGLRTFIAYYDENGDTKILDNRDTQEIEENLYKTIDVTTGKQVVVHKNENSTRYEIVGNGDVNTDGNIDMLDLTTLNRDVVKIAEIPEYLDIVSDTNKDGTVGIQDLTMLKKHLIKMVDITNIG